MDYWHFITPLIYLALVVIWAYILAIYTKRIFGKSKEDKLLYTLVFVLAIDAFRTLLESTYFGVWYTSLAGIIPIEIYNFLAQPEIVFFPKIINLIVSVIILLILIRRWLPAHASRQEEQASVIRNHTHELQDIIDNLNKTQNELLEQKQLFEIMFNTIPDGVVITNTKREILLANNGMKTTFGYEPDEILGKKTELLYADKTKYEDAGTNVFNEQAKSPDNLYLTYYKTKNNTDFTGETFGTKLYDNEGVWKGNLGIMRNVSERVSFISEINKAKEKAEESDHLKSAFLANMSHEIRTPMNGIIGFTSLLQEPNLTGEEQQTYLDIIQKSGDRMLNTVNDIIEISKIETGQVNLLIKEVNINEHLVDLYNFFKPETENKGMQLLLKNELKDSEALIKTDELKFTSIVTNLIKNAIKYSDEGVITIACKKLKKQLEISVKDTGIGIPENRLNAVFERFVQADIDDRHVHQGSGLGLAITKSYVKMLGGSISVESIEGAGSKFTFTIEYNPVKLLKRKEDSSSIEIESGLLKKITILVAEDDDTSYGLLQAVLTTESCMLIRAKNGKEAVEKYSEPGIDFILMDIRMPVMDGLKATQIIREQNTTIPIIAQTAFALEGDKEKALASGCNDYITKPIVKTKLIEVIRQYLIVQ